MVDQQKSPLPGWLNPYVERLWTWVFSSTGSKIAWATVAVGLAQIASPWWLPIVEAVVRTRLPNVSLVANPAIGLALVLAAFVYHLAFLYIENLKGKVGKVSELQLQQERDMFVNTYVSRRNELRDAAQWSGNWLHNVRETLGQEQPEEFSTSYIVDRRRFGFEDLERVHDLRFFQSADNLRNSLNHLVKAVFDYNDTAWILSRHATFVVLTRGVAEAFGDDDDHERAQRRQESAKHNAERSQRLSEKYPGCELLGDIIKDPRFVSDVAAAKARVAEALPPVAEALNAFEAEMKRVDRQHQKAIEQAKE